MPRKPRSLRERFLAKVDTSGGPEACHPWTARRDDDGYGRIRSSGKGYPYLRSNRAAWELAYGPIPEGLCVCHKCDNPPCVNPAHLFLGTHADNHADMCAKGRKVHGEGVSNSKLREAQVNEIFLMHANGISQRKIAKHMGVSDSLVWKILHGEAWALTQRRVLQRMRAGGREVTPSPHEGMRGDGAARGRLPVPARGRGE
jgi:predicted DNA-binding protein (UPF0251 family)